MEPNDCEWKEETKKNQKIHENKLKILKKKNLNLNVAIRI